MCEWLLNVFIYTAHTHCRQFLLNMAIFIVDLSEHFDPFAIIKNCGFFMYLSLVSACMMVNINYLQSLAGVEWHTQVSVESFNVFLFSLCSDQMAR